jgi:hypothetical protein
MCNGPWLMAGGWWLVADDQFALFIFHFAVVTHGVRRPRSGEQNEIER